MKDSIFLSKNNFLPHRIASLLQKCLKSKALKAGKQIHAYLLATCTNLTFFSLNSKLVGMYASCGDTKFATLVFKNTQNPDVFAFNWMVLASTFNGNHKQAIGYFCLMQKAKSLPFYNKFTFSILLKACVGLLDLNKGKQVHAVVTQMGFENDVLMANSLIDFYWKCGCECYACKVFDRMVQRDVASWTSMICGYCNVGEIEQALVLFERMKLEGFEPNDFTWCAMITGYARRGDSDGAIKLLARMIRAGFVPDLVTWNAMISGFVQGYRAGEAFKLFSEMLALGIKPNLVTVTGLLPACGMIGSIKRGREIHGLIYRFGFDFNVFIASALIDMYSKCGSTKDARILFEKVRDKNAASWNAMIGCYGKHGMVNCSIQLLERMQVEGVQANEVTLASVLSACAHSGLIEKGLKIFRSMKDVYSIDPNKEHYACVIDMLCRSGRMEEAYEMVKNMPLQVSESIAGAFFNGCLIHGRGDLAKLVSEDIMTWDLDRPGGFTTLSNIYAACGEWEKVEDMRNAMRMKKVHKKPGFSLVEKKDALIRV